MDISRLCLGGFIAVVAQRKSRGERIISRLIPTLPISPPFSPTAPLSAGVSIPFLYFLYFGMTNSLFPLLLFRKARPFIAALFQRDGTPGQTREKGREKERERERALAVKFPGGVIPCQDRRGRDINSPTSPLGNTMGAKNKQSSISPLFSSRGVSVDTL